MKLVRFLKRAFYADNIVEPGTEILVDDAVVLGAHMLDLSEPAAPRPIPRIVLPTPPMTSLEDTVRAILSPDEARTKATEEAIARADAERAAEETKTS